MNKHNFIVIEGVDGSGKTSVGERLAKKIDGAYFATPPEGYEDIRDYINEAASPEARFLYYLSSVIDVSDKIKKSKENKTSVCVRYVWSTLVYHAVLEETDLIEVKQMVKPFESYIVRPTKNVLLTVSKEEQIRRLNYRNGGNHTVSDKLSIEDESFRRSIEEAYTKLTEEESWIKIDTTNKSIDQVVDEIIEKCYL